MSKFPKIDRLERIYFEGAAQNALSFSNQIKSRYKSSGFKMPVDVKCLVWVCDCAFALLQPYVSVMRNLQKENVHKSENY